MNKKFSKNFAADVLFRAGIFNALHRFTAKKLTVLNYHRINDSTSPDFDQYIPNVSASPQGFADHLDFLIQHFNFVTIQDVANFIANDGCLPDHAALITFDDGYQDNLTNAYPILKEKNVPAAIFVTANYMGTNRPYYWDLIAYSFFHTIKEEAQLPLIGHMAFPNKRKAQFTADKLVAALKQIPEEEKLEILAQVPDLLNVEIPDTAFDDLHLSWDQVRSLSSNGVTIGSHTLNHPILTCVSRDQARKELHDSKTKIEREIGKPVWSLAYPNGSKADFDEAVIRIANDAGYRLAFSLIASASTYTNVLQHPFSIKRIFISRNDTVARLAAKVSGVWSK